MYLQLTPVRQALIIAVIALCLSVVSLGLSLKPSSKKAPDIQYMMYLGTNDKDTDEPVCAPDEAREKAADDLIQAFNQSSILIQANETTTEFYSSGS